MRHRLVDHLEGILQSTPATRLQDLKFEGFHDVDFDYDIAVHRLRRKARQFHSKFDEVVGVCNTKGDDFTAITHTLFNVSTASWCSHLKQTLGTRFVRGEVVATLASRSESTVDFQWLGIKKMVFHLENELCRPREATFYEFCGTTIDREGQDVFFIIRESVKERIEKGRQPIVTMQIREWIVFTKCHDGTIESMHYYHAEPRGRIASFLFRKYALKHLAYCVRARHIAYKAKGDIKLTLPPPQPTERISTDTIYSSVVDSSMESICEDILGSAEASNSPVPVSTRQSVNSIPEDMRRVQEGIVEQQILVEMIKLQFGRLSKG
ncbi:hypothetical protein THRCLA_21956 [Thraustotheca clavata]|uniref:START domain-containing protein n=1 Tax=Thraustotheca clavata TaxID=74557 RepID=A0A1V9ZH45_9STRA|nr:hypothetical protein THRCLA_21956 [Thraustotheca clavata]